MNDIVLFFEELDAIESFGLGLTILGVCIQVNGAAVVLDTVESLGDNATNLLAGPAFPADSRIRYARFVCVHRVSSDIPITAGSFTELGHSASFSVMTVPGLSKTVCS